ncbi:MAG: insulinase family protein, partial [Bacteroidia bacterium]|nr:insulinase family protein [Bacteroidia bacterium]
MKAFFYTTLFLLMATALPAQYTPELETYTLKNGLKIYLLKYGKIEAMHVKVMINSGKKNETPGQQGYNAIVSDMILKGNKKFTEEEQNDKAFALGSEFSSGTGYDYTSVSCNLKTKDAKPVLEMISAAVLQPLFDKEKLDQLISYLISYNSPTKMNIDEMAGVYSSHVLHGTDNPLGRHYYNKQLK